MQYVQDAFLSVIFRKRSVALLKENCEISE